MKRLLTVLGGWGLLLTSSATAHTVPVGVQLKFVATNAPFDIDANLQYTDVWAEGRFAYLGSLSSGVAVIDISSGAQHVATYAPAGHADFQDVKVWDGIGYFSGSLGTDVVNLSNPIAPVMLSRISSSSGGHDSARNVAVDDEFLYQAAEASSQVHVFDITNPAAPSFVRTIDTHDSGGIFDVTLIGDRLYAAGLGGATYLYDVTNVASQQPQLWAAIPTGANTSSAWPMADGDTLLAVHRVLGGELAAWDISSPTAASLIQSVDPSDLAFNSYSTSEVVVDGSVAYVAWYQAGLEVIDLDQLGTTGMQRAGFYIPAPPGSPLDGFTRVRSVFPMLGPDQILISDTRNGLYVLDATKALPLKPGDYDGDGTVGLSDYEAWRTAFGSSPSNADGNGNGIVDSGDYVIWRNSYSPSSFNSEIADQQIPESRSLTIVVAAAMTLAVFRCVRYVSFSWRATP